ncbi:hypothetical protein STCU_02863 [Strigomonas culicis]|nr:hypothetical protein STCU_02863 [Strigomonas culicis]|eukprot:EPY32334.1 hypothetical protein STCU_02863 [Strigomonas culicis]
MSLVGVSSYFLWTQKGQTILPLVRGSGFLLRFKQQGTFYHYHVITAAHVSCPVRYRGLYGDSVGFKAIGERHVSARMLTPHAETHQVQHALDMEFRQHYMPNVDVAALRCRDEAQLDGLRLAPFEVDEKPIEDGTELVYCGFDAIEERANPNDDGLTLREVRLDGTCKAAIVSLDYGTVLAGSIDSLSDDERAQGKQMPLSLSGGPVLRKSTGKVVGVVAARIMKNAPPRDPHAGTLYQDPYLDLSENVSLHQRWPLDVAFVPIGEFYNSLCRSEM